ncbi:MAG TPA: hypothetical protein PLV50_08755 [Smithella sp.]|nr:hypothetical protein [Smithella sp.]HOG90615.1 hypothetical protein [Smithella sp.]
MMVRIKNHGRIKVNVLIVFAVVLFFALASILSLMNRAVANNQDDLGAKQAFIEASQVLFHPRCLNCHPSGDLPLVQDDSQPHRFNVKRGADGKGIDLKCTMCHRNENQQGGPPGAPNWHMPPENMPMIFQGRTPGQLCRQLKDPKQNGGRTGEQIVDHIDHDPLVLRGWTPGDGRTQPKLSQKEFSVKMHEWLKKGAACPE